MIPPASSSLTFPEQDESLQERQRSHRLLSIINGDVDYKAQSLQLASAPALLDGQEQGNYTVDLRPEITLGVFSFNVTHEDEAKRAVFGDVRFGEAMSIAINRNELNEVGFFGQGTPQQYIGFSPKPAFVSDKWLSHATEFDTSRANSLLDEIGMKDADGDGFRELPNGDKLVLNMSFSTPGDRRSDC